MAVRCRLLVAVTPMGYLHVRRSLHAGFELVSAFSLHEAITTLKESEIDAILCSVHFDESRMFDLLGAAKEFASGKPFICCVMLDSRLSPDYLDRLISTAKSSGACGFVDYNSMQRSAGFPEADRRFREEIARLLGRDCGPLMSASNE